MNEVTALGCATCRLSHQGRKGPKTTESFLTPRQPLPSRTEVKLVLLLNRGTGGTIPTVPKKQKRWTRERTMPSIAGNTLTKSREGRGWWKGGHMTASERHRRRPSPTPWLCHTPRATTAGSNIRRKPGLQHASEVERFSRANTAVKERQRMLIRYTKDERQICFNTPLTHRHGWIREAFEPRQKGERTKCLPRNYPSRRLKWPFVYPQKPTLPMETQTRNALRLQHLADRRWTRIFSAAETNPGSHQEQHLKQGRDSARDHNEQRGKKKRKWEEGPSGALWCRYAPGRKIWFWVLGQYLTRHQNTQFVVIASPTTH